MKRALHAILQTIVKYIAKGMITGKPMQASNLILHYEVDQFLGFLFQRKIAYEPRLQQKLSKYISESSLVFDVGSNIGQYALWFSHLAPHGRVICYEPDSKNFAFLSFNVLFNRRENIELCKCGLGDSISEQTFYRDTITGGRSGSLGVEFVNDKYEGATESIRVSTLDEQVERFGVPDFVKIDVEGFEYSVLKGLTQVSPTTSFFVEVRDTSATKVFNYFSEKGFNCVMLDEKTDKAIGSLGMIPGFCNLLFTHKD